jgi:hypothetical protein
VDGCNPREPENGARSAGETPPRDLRDLAILGVVAFLALQVFFHVFDLRAVNPDVDVFLKRTINHVDAGQPLDQGNLIGYGFRLGPFANRWSTVPLLASHDLRAQYYFITLQDLLAVALIFLAMRQLFGAGIGKWIAAAAYAFHFLLTPFAAEHNYYLPFFLAFYFYFLALSARGRTWAIVPAWFFLGVAMQTHMSAVSLVLPTMIVTRFWRSRLSFLYTVLGAAGLAAVNISLIDQALSHLAPGGPHLNENEDLLRVMRGTLGTLPWSAPPIVAATVVMGGLGKHVYAALTLARLDRCFRTLRTDRHVVIGAAAALALTWGVMLPLYLVRYRVTAARFSPTTYFFPASPFLCYFAGLFFQRVKMSPPFRNWRENGARHAKIFAALTGVTVIAILTSAIAARLFPGYFVNVGNQLAVYHHVAAAVERNRLSNFRFSQCNRFSFGRPASWGLGKPGLYYYAEPQLRGEATTVSRQAMVVVVDSKAALELWAELSAHSLTRPLSGKIMKIRGSLADCGVRPRARLLDHFDTRDMDISIYFDLGEAAQDQPAGPP